MFSHAIKALGGGLTAVLLALGAALPAAAQNEAGSADRLVGTLKGIRDRGAVRIGYRSSSPPFSYLDARGRPVGYSLDLCSALVEDIADELGGIELRTELLPVYALMFRPDDPAFAAVVERGFRRLASSGEFSWIYDKWFIKRLPSGLRPGLPMSPQLEESLRILGLQK